MMENKESKTNKHFKLSIFKSAIRMFACSALMMNELMAAGSLLFIAECLGVAEEM